jgi:hypothetical protein
MTEDEFEQLTLRFGTDVTSWPVPFRQQALRLSAGKRDLSADRDDALDRLVLDAALIETDERRLTAQVLARIDRGHSRSFGWRLADILLRPPAMAACAALLALALAAGGYQLASSKSEALDAKLLALATGSPFSGELLEISLQDDTENAL